MEKLTIEQLEALRNYVTELDKAIHLKDTTFCDIMDAIWE